MSNFNFYNLTNNNNYMNNNNYSNNEEQFKIKSGQYQQTYHSFHMNTISVDDNKPDIVSLPFQHNFDIKAETSSVCSVPINPLKRSVNATSNKYIDRFYVPPKIESVNEKIMIIKNEDDLAIAVKKIGINKIEEEEADENDALPYLSDDDPIIACEEKYATHIPPLTFPENVQSHELFEIFLAEVNSPNRFWFNIATECPALDKLMNDIDTYYQSIPQNKLLIERKFIKKGKICCTLFGQVWHRGEIVGEIQSNNKVDVFFFDYGTTTEVSLNQIKYLLKKFEFLPRQAIRGSLYGITSMEHRWKREATYALIKMITDLKLFCSVMEVDHEHNIFFIMLYDTTKTEDIVINQELVTAKHAKLLETEPSLLRRKYFSEVFPTFESLEIGHYPSFEKIGDMLRKGIDFEHFDDANEIAFDKLYVTNEITTININNENPFYNMDIKSDDDSNNDTDDPYLAEIIQNDKIVNKQLQKMHVDPNFIENNHIFVSKIANPFK